MRIVTLIAMTGLGCSSTRDPPPAPPSDGIELIDGGALPRRELRYHLAKGTTTTLELAMDLDFAMDTRGGAMPTIVMQMAISADDVLADGSARIRTKIIGASARDRPRAEISTQVMNTQAMLLAGLEVTATLTARGRLTDSKIATPKDLPPGLASQLTQLDQSLAQVAMPLPGPPVGVGAKWRNRKPVTQNNVKMETITTVEVVAIDGDKVTFKSASEVTGADQKVDVDGTQVAITKIGGGGIGSGTIDLGRMAMAGAFNADFRFEMTAPNGSTPMRMGLAMRLQPIAPQGAHSAP